MTLGRALFLLILMVTAFFGLSVKEHREAITLWEAKVATLRGQLVNTRDELGRRITSWSPRPHITTTRRMIRM